MSSERTTHKCQLAQISVARVALPEPSPPIPARTIILGTKLHDHLLPFCRRNIAQADGVHVPYEMLVDWFAREH